MKFNGLITKGIMKGVITSSGSSATMTSDFKNIKKSTAVYAASKGYEHWLGVIKIMEPGANYEWRMKRPDKSPYAVKRTTKLINDDKLEILKQEWVMIYYEKQEEAEDNYRKTHRTGKTALLCLSCYMANFIVTL